MTERRYRWPTELPRPKHRYRDTLLVYLGMCIVVVLFAWLSGGSIVKGVVVAVILFAVASVYSLVRWHDLVRHLRGRGDRR